MLVLLLLSSSTTPTLADEAATVEAAGDLKSSNWDPHHDDKHGINSFDENGMLKRGLQRRLLALNSMLHSQKPPVLPLVQSGDVYQFGVFTGGGMKGWVDGLRNESISFRHMWGFDSFEGMPPSDVKKHSPHDAAIQSKDSLGWQQGSLNAADQLLPILGMDAYNVTKLTQHIVKAVGYGAENTTLWPGFFSKSLPKLMHAVHAEERRADKGVVNHANGNKPALPLPKPAVIVDIDCDIYEGTIQAFEWLIAHPLLASGTLLYYDDWRQFNEGEVKAHHELTARYKLKWRRLVTGSRWNHYLYQLTEAPSAEAVQEAKARTTAATTAPA